MDIRTYDPDDSPALRAFIAEHWRAGHPYTDRVLFEWQFTGFAADRPASKLLVHEGRIAGFLGGIPGLYWAASRVWPGVVYDLWVVRPDLRNGGMGLLLMKALEDEYPVSCCLGVNADVVKYYTIRGYGYSPEMVRWVIPLDAERFAQLVSRGSGGARFETLAAPDLNGAARVYPLRSPDTLALQIIYERTVEAVFALALHRNAEFWTWRYLRSAGFKYHLFGSVASSGIIVARVETTISPEAPELDGARVLRLIELLPARPETWRGENDDEHLSLLRSVLAWAATRGCLLADFQHSSDRLAHLLDKAGFTRVSPSASSGRAAIPALFQPLRFDVPPINYVWRLARPVAGEAPLEPRDIYFVKSDDGMDRPNVWPLPVPA